MELNLRTIKNKVERLTCSTHGKHPVGKIQGSKIDFKCCCENFKSICLQNSQKFFQEEAKRTLDDMLKKAFKK